MLFTGNTLEFVFLTVVGFAGPRLFAHKVQDYTHGHKA